MPHAFRLLLLSLALGIGGISAASAQGGGNAASPAAVAAPRLPEIGDETSLEALARPDRFAWPARFVCRPDPGGRETLAVVGESFEELNERLAAADVLLEDCRGGFALESLAPQDGKLDRIVGGAAHDDT